jgi:hypothetical protein
MVSGLWFACMGDEEKAGSFVPVFINNEAISQKAFFRNDKN